MARLAHPESLVCSAALQPVAGRATRVAIRLPAKPAAITSTIVGAGAESSQKLA